MKARFNKAALFFLIALIISACASVSNNTHQVLSLDQAPVEGVWSIAIDSLPGGFVKLYSLRAENSQTELLILVCFDLQTKKRQHYELQLGDSLKYRLLTYNPVVPRSFMLNGETNCAVIPPGDLLIVKNILSQQVDSLKLIDKKFFASNLQPILRDNNIVVPYVDLSYNLKSKIENEQFFKRTKPLISIDLKLNKFQALGSYPPDYSQKAIYAYHLSPNILLKRDQGILMSFPGSNFVGLSNENSDSQSTFKEFISEYHYEYSPMDTANIMEISKAIQFQDTASRYVQIGYSQEYDKMSRTYHRHKPMTLKGEKYYGSLLICDFTKGIVEKEYLFRSGENYKYTKLLPLDKGILKIEYLSTSSIGPAMKFSMIDVF